MGASEVKRHVCVSLRVHIVLNACICCGMMLPKLRPKEPSRRRGGAGWRPRQEGVGHRVTP